jgi:carboxyl-terminal processing protease
MQGRLRLVKAVAAIGAALAIGAGIGPALHGCSGDGAYGRAAMAAVGFDAYRLSVGSRQELARFRTVFDTYAVASDNTRPLKHFQDAYKRIAKSYVEPPPDRKLIDAAIQGIEARKPKPHSVPPWELVETALDAMAASLDPHSSYLNPEELRESELVTSGEFGGLGIQVTQQDGQIRVIAPLEGTPADRAGVKPGDVITQINGTSTQGLSLKDAVNSMRGQPGTKVQLTLQRDGRGTFVVTIARAVITIEPVRWFTEGDVGYVRIVGFNEKAGQRLQDGFRELRKSRPSLSGIVLDLRNNPGGLLDQAVAIADDFLDQGQIVTIRGRDPASERGYTAEKGDLAQGLPVVVLVNAGSASAAEIVASALKDHGRAVVMGTPSFGKGSVQTVMRLPERGALKLTTALYYTPNGQAIQARGVIPNILLSASSEDAKAPHEADLPGAFPARDDTAVGTAATVDTEACAPVGAAKDREIGCAVAYLSAGSTDRFLALLKVQPRL